MNTIVLKVQEWELEEFIDLLHPDSISEMWIRLCNHNKYEYSPFSMTDFINMLHANPNVAGIELIEFERGVNVTDSVEEYIKDYISE
jgi:hypothetical protein